jgi:DNA-binding MarR family transcriptional regulator
MTSVPIDVTRLAGELKGVVGQLHRRLRQVDNADVLTPSQSAVLGRLHRHGPATQAQLASGEQIRQQSMATILNALDELGYLERSRDPRDGRRVQISLSGLGRKTVRGVGRHREEWLASALVTLSPEERETVARALPLMQRVAQN